MDCDWPDLHWSDNLVPEGSAAKRIVPRPYTSAAKTASARLSAPSPRCFDRAHQIRRTKRLLQTDDVGELGRFG